MPAMQYPSFGEYEDALQQDLGAALSDPVLRGGALCMRGPGLPAVYGGTYALTFAVATSSGKYAVRCFHRELDALNLRYAAIERCLGQVDSPEFVDCRFQPQGITTESGTYPVVRMDWVHGPTLAAYVAEHRYDAGAMLELRFSLRRLAMRLRNVGVAHGDIQPSNVIVQSDGSLRLIDYDGLFVPELAPLCSAELGQRNFQHPGRRSRHFDANLDVFSFAVIDFALRALCVRPDLWELTGSGDHAFLMRASDYADPARSPTFALLAREPGFERRTRDLAAVCAAPFESIPPLEELVAGRGIPAVSIGFSGGATRDRRPPYLPAHSLVDAVDFAQCCRHVGERVELVGRVASVATAPASGTAPECLRVEFGEGSHDVVCLRLWKDSLARFERAPDDTWVGEWLSAVGLVEPVANVRKDAADRKDVSITIAEPSQLQRLTPAEADYRLRSLGVSPARTPDPAGAVRTEPVPAEERTEDAGRPERSAGPAQRPRVSRWLWWMLAAALAVPVVYVLSPSDVGRERTEPSGNATTAVPPAGVTAGRAPATEPVAGPVEDAPAVVEPIAGEDLDPSATTLETLAGVLSVFPSSDGGCRRIGLPDGTTVPDLCEDSIVFAHRTVFADREVVVGFTRCADVEAPCGLRRPFWIDLRADSPPQLRQMPSLWAGSGQPTVSSSKTGVRIDLGTWNGVHRHATLSAAGNIVVERRRVPARPLGRSDCALVTLALEDCAASRDCASFEGSARLIPAARWLAIVRAYHESTGLDVAAFRKLCVRSCELRLTPSPALVQTYACRGAPPDQWPPDDPMGGLLRQ
jgi:hypothetical protein